MPLSSAALVINAFPQDPPITQEIVPGGVEGPDSSLRLVSYPQTITSVRIDDLDLRSMRPGVAELAVQSRLNAAVDTAIQTQSSIIRVNMPDTTYEIDLVSNEASYSDTTEFVGLDHYTTTDAWNTLASGTSDYWGTLTGGTGYSLGNYTTTTATSAYNDLFRVTSDGSAVSITTDPRYRVVVRQQQTPEDIAKAAALAKRNRFLSELRAKLAPAVVRKRKGLGTAHNSPAELKARETLQEMLLESEWRRYITNGFIMVRGPSGKWYQIFNDHYRRIQVYEKGIHVNNLCIHTDGECPPTDHVIGMKVRVELDEESLWKQSNIFDMKNNRQINANTLANTVVHAPTTWELINNVIATAS